MSEQQEKKTVNEITMNVNLRRTREVSRTKRTPYAIRMLKSLASRHLHVDADKVGISQSLNEAVWSRGIQKPPRKIKVKLIKYEDGSALIDLAAEQ
ncbi:50S ribosomal protein L31e [Thermocladium modestius]|uniref:Large ribosomal subunit protein eL31 n=1 Tax=Thermocladium modestius TaxID=62609 RepID=A0A830GWH6_9CREN|nr:50S ribosomal protein L31e [Thermocladium modestius]GGP21737.1 50S ribosomal protein L31e [Thermocladium modestius]